MIALIATTILAPRSISAEAQSPPTEQEPATPIPPNRDAPTEKPPAESPPAENPDVAAPTEPAPTPAAAHDLLMEGYYDRARAMYVALAKTPEHETTAAVGIARCMLAVGEYDPCIEHLAGFADRPDAPADAPYLLAIAQRAVGQYPEALDHARAAIERDDDHAPARYFLGELLEYLGRRDDAIEAYRWFETQLVNRPELPHDAEWLTYVGQGFLRYSMLTQKNLVQRTKHVLTQMYQQAYGRIDRAYWPARIAAAELLREKHNNDEHDGSMSDYQAALRINANLPEAHVGMGHVALEDWQFEKVEHRVRLALEINPRFAPAFHLLAGNLITERRYREARDECDKALAINPNDIDALSLKAAAFACEYDDEAVAKLEARVAAINPRCATFHRTLGDALGGIRQYAASERAYLKAVEFDPTNANAFTELGMMYMQWGEPEKAREVLEAAWRLDEFNQGTDFTLSLLDNLDEFKRVETEHFIVKYRPETDPGLGEYVAAYMEEIYPIVTGDYDTELTEKTVIEIFPTHKEFGVRITGKPWIPTVGACTGRVIALDAPRRSPDLIYGPYHIGNVLMHEFTHTVTLAATKNRIPHWFTEGLAVYQENKPRSFDWTEMLAEAVRRDELFTLEQISWRFMRPRRPIDRTQAYAQSEWMCEYIVERFGYDSILTMLKAFRDGATQDVVFREKLGIEPDAFDRDFKAWAHEQARQWGYELDPPESVTKLRALALVKPEDADVLGRLARAQYDAQQLEPALASAKEALAIDENQPDSLEIFVTVLAAFIEKERSEAGRRSYEEEALPALRRLAEVDPKSWIAPKVRARIALRREHYAEAIEPLQKLQRLCPQDPFSWEGLAGVYLKQNQLDEALVQLRELARIAPDDPEVPINLGRILHRKGQLGDARYWFGQALLIDPFNVEVHQTMGEICLRLGDDESALREYQMLTRIEPNEAKHHERAAFAAKKLGDKAVQQQHAKQAVELDPTSPAAGLLVDD